MYSVAVLGATGYSGIELLRLLTFHSKVDVKAVTADKNAGYTLDKVVPPLKGYYRLTCKKIEDIITEKFDVVFLALPSEQSKSVIKEFLNPGSIIIDLSDAFRLKTKQQDSLLDAIYGLPELNRAQIKSAKLIANPGCYPTGAIIPLAPLLKVNIIKKERIIIDSKSGVTGAGRNPSQELHFSEVHEGFKAYKPIFHRHVPEILQALNVITGGGVNVTFVPHLVPSNRGIFTTIYASAESNKNITQAMLEDLLIRAFKDEPFVRILKSPELPDTNAVKGSNFIDIAVRFDEQDSTVILFSAIDNLVKGASGQAIQNMNLALGLDEKEGLFTPPLFP